MTKVDYKKVTQVVNFLVNQYSSGLPKLKLVKLIWAADRYHLRKYARLVTEDDYFAMKNGPVASCVKDVIEFSVNEYSNLDESNLSYIRKFIKNENGIISSISPPNMDYLSDTDAEALHFAISTFGKLSESELISLTHRYPEWLAQSQQLEPPVGNGHCKSKDIIESDFYKNPTGIANDPFIINESELEDSKKIFLELA